MHIDAILCTLGFSVFPDWQSVFERTFKLLASGGGYAILDLYNEQHTFQTRIVNMFASSDIYHQVWKPLQEPCKEYREEHHPRMHGDTIIIATRTKQ